MADPGFPVGDVDPFGGVDLQCGCFSPKMCVKMKELGPMGGMDPLEGCGPQKQVLFTENVCKN